MIRGLLSSSALCLAFASAALAQYKMEPAGPPPAEAGAYAQVLQKEGFKILNGSTPWAEIWFRSSMPSGPKSAEENVTLPTVPHGSLIAVIHFFGDGADRRGQRIKPGFYTMRFSEYPVNGDHQGVAPQRDFLVLTPATNDRDPNATPNYETLMKWSLAASGTPHPAVFSFWKADTDFKAGFEKQGNDWVLQTKVGDTPVALILVGRYEG